MCMTQGYLVTHGLFYAPPWRFPFCLSTLHQIEWEYVCDWVRYWWSLKFFSPSSFLPKKNRKKELTNNYCRNPDNAISGPWCFTTDPNVRHQVCGVPECLQGRTPTHAHTHTHKFDHCQQLVALSWWILSLNAPHWSPLICGKLQPSGISGVFSVM